MRWFIRYFELRNGLEPLQSYVLWWLGENEAIAGFSMVLLFLAFFLNWRYRDGGYKEGIKTITFSVAMGYRRYYLLLENFPT